MASVVDGAVSLVVSNWLARVMPTINQNSFRTAEHIRALVFLLLILLWGRNQRRLHDFSSGLVALSRAGSTSVSLSWCQTALAVSVDHYNYKVTFSHVYSRHRTVDSSETLPIPYPAKRCGGS